MSELFYAMLSRVKPYKNNRGITLLELTIAAALVLIVSGVIFWGMSTRDNDHRALESASTVLQADIRYVQRRAIMEGRRVGIEFDWDNNRYHILIETLESTNTNLSFATERTVYLPDGITFHPTRRPNLSNNRLTYTLRGTPSAGTTIRLARSEYQQRITVNLSGGRAFINPIQGINENP